MYTLLSIRLGIYLGYQDIDGFLLVSNPGVSVRSHAPRVVRSFEFGTRSSHGERDVMPRITTSTLEGKASVVPVLILRDTTPQYR